MATRNANLLLDNAAAPTAGLKTATAIMHYGGPLSAVITGVFDGATVEVMACSRLPDRAGILSTDPLDWLSLGKITEPGRVNVPNLNPCVIAVQIAGAIGGNCRIRALTV